MFQTGASSKEHQQWPQIAQVFPSIWGSNLNVQSTSHLWDGFGDVWDRPLSDVICPRVSVSRMPSRWDMKRPLPASILLLWTAPPETGTNNTPKGSALNTGTNQLFILLLRVKVFTDARVGRYFSVRNWCAPSEKVRDGTLHLSEEKWEVIFDKPIRTMD